MNENTIREALKKGERVTLECKKAMVEVPKSLWETYSAFANTIGGLILLGVEEHKNETDVAKRYEIVGVKDAQKILADFWNTINSDKVNANILTDSDVGLTLAGLMMFGKGLAIRDRLANFRMDYLDMSHLVSGERYHDRLTYDGLQLLNKLDLDEVELMMPLPLPNVVKDVVKDVVKELPERQRFVLEIIKLDPYISAKVIAEQITEKDSGRTKVTSRTIQRDLANLQKIGILTREGGRKDGRWVIVE